MTLATLSSGISEYVDSTVEDEQSCIYSARSFDLDNEEAVGVFIAQFTERMATLLSISPERIIVTELAVGSVIVSFEIAEPQ